MQVCLLGANIDALPARFNLIESVIHTVLGVVFAKWPWGILYAGIITRQETSKGVVTVFVAGVQALPTNADRPRFRG